MKTRTLVAVACAVAAQAVFAKTPEEVSEEKGYPACYCADTESAEARQALVAELWKHDPAADTKLWPEGKIPLKANDNPIKNVEDELWQRNLIVTDVSFECSIYGKFDRKEKRT